jgi:hypothetical protein
MRCPSNAGSSFLVIAAQSFARWILSVDGDRAPISIAHKSRDHGSPQSEKKHQTAKKSKAKKPMESEWSASSVTIAAPFSQGTIEGAPLRKTMKPISGFSVLAPPGRRHPVNGSHQNDQRSTGFPRSLATSEARPLSQAYKQTRGSSPFATTQTG